MCCFFTALVFFGPRLGFLIYWLAAPRQVSTAFKDFNFPFLVGTLGLIFIPWTTLWFVILFPFTGYDWIWLGFGVMADVASYLGAYHKRQAVPGYPANDPLASI